MLLLTMQAWTFLFTDIGRTVNKHSLRITDPTDQSYTDM